MRDQTAEICHQAASFGAIRFIVGLKLRSRVRGFEISVRTTIGACGCYRDNEPALQRLRTSSMTMKSFISERFGCVREPVVARLKQVQRLVQNILKRAVSRS